MLRQNFSSISVSHGFFHKSKESNAAGAAAVVEAGDVAQVVVDASSTGIAVLYRKFDASFGFHSPVELFYSDSEKKINQGWGANQGKAELTAETQAEADATKESGEGAAAAAADDWGVSATPAAADAEGDAAVNGSPTEKTRKFVEEEDNSLTLDEYLAQKKESAVVPKIEAVRRANEGADESQWKDIVPLSKEKEDENYFVGKVRHFFFTLISPTHPSH